VCLDQIGVFRRIILAGELEDGQDVQSDEMGRNLRKLL